MRGPHHHIGGHFTFRFIRGRTVEHEVKKLAPGKRLSNCCKRGGFAGAGKGLNLQRRAHIQITRSLANGVLFVGKIH